MIPVGPPGPTRIPGLRPLDGPIIPVGPPGPTSTGRRPYDPMIPEGPTGPTKTPLCAVSLRVPSDTGPTIPVGPLGPMRTPGCLCLFCGPTIPVGPSGPTSTPSGFSKTPMCEESWPCPGPNEPNRPLSAEAGGGGKGRAKFSCPGSSIGRSSSTSLKYWFLCWFLFLFCG